MQQPFLTGEHVYLRPLEVEDADRVRGWLNDPAVPHVAASIKRFGWQQPVVAKPSGEVIAGNTVYYNFRFSADTVADIPLSIDIEEFNIFFAPLNSIPYLLVKCPIMTPRCIYFHRLYT